MVKKYFSSSEESETEREDESPDETEDRLAELRAERDSLREQRDELRDELAEVREKLAQKDSRLRDLEGSLAELQGFVEANAEGDLTRRVEIESETEAVVAFVSTYNRMLDEWNTTLKRVKSFSSDVEESTTTVGTEIESVEEGSEQVTQSVTQIVDGADMQSENLEAVSEEMDQLSATIEEVAAAANEVADISDQAVDRGKESQEAVTTAVDRLEQMATQTQETMDHIETLQDRVADIEAVVEFINDVAEQTNMLALNANIEAARVDGDGEGFGVVANEIKQLASETKDATDRIEQSIEDVQSQTDRTVADMRETSETMTESKTAVMSVLDGLDEVVATVEEANEHIREIDRATDEQAKSTQEVSASVREVTEISEETTTQARTVQDAVREQNVALTSVSEEINELSGRAERLSQTSQEFDTGKRNRRVIHDSDTVIRFHHAMTGSKALLLQDLAEEFEQQTEGIRLKPISMGSYPAALRSVVDVDHEQRPALAQVYDIGTAQARKAECFQPVENLVSADVLDTLVESVRGYYEVDGRLHSLPFNCSNPILCYNRKQFDRAGLDPSSPPTTFEEIRETSEQLCSRANTDYGLSFAIYSWYVEQWFSEAGQLLVDAENGRSGAPERAFLDSDFGHQLFEWWVGMEEDGLYHNPGIHGHSAALNAFHDETAAMFIGSTASLNRIQAGADFPLDTAYFPVLDDRNGVLVGGASLWVRRDLDLDIESALGEFLTWLLQPEQQATWHQETGYFPVVDGAIDRLESDGWFETNPQFATAFRQFQESTDSPATNGAQTRAFPDIRELIHQGRDKMATAADVEPVLADTNSQIESLLDESEN